MQKIFFALILVFAFPLFSMKRSREESSDSPLMNLPDELLLHIFTQPELLAPDQVPTTLAARAVCHRFNTLLGDRKVLDPIADSIEKASNRSYPETIQATKWIPRAKKQELIKAWLARLSERTKEFIPPYLFHLEAWTPGSNGNVAVAGYEGTGEYIAVSLFILDHNESFIARRTKSLFFNDNGTPIDVNKERIVQCVKQVAITYNPDQTTFYMLSKYRNLTHHMLLQYEPRYNGIATFDEKTNWRSKPYKRWLTNRLLPFLRCKYVKIRPVKK